MRTHKTKPAPERAEEPVEPVKATTTPPADHAATDALLAVIEETLDEATVEEQKPESKPWAFDPEFVASLLDTMPPQWMMERFFTPEPEPRDEIPWDEIAKLPPPGPGGTHIRYMVPEEIDWTELRDPDTMVIRSNERALLVTREMWNEAQDRVLRQSQRDPRRRFWDRPRRSRNGDDGMCPRCGWPIAGPGRYPCNGAPGPESMDPRVATRITNC